MAKISEYLFSPSTRSLSSFFSKEIDLNAPDEAETEAKNIKIKGVAEKAIAVTVTPQKLSSNTNSAAPAKVDAKKASSPAVIALVAKLPEDTLSKLYEAQQSLMQELDRMLDKSERLTRLGQWEKANGILNDLKLVNLQIKILIKAKNLSKEEQKTVGNGNKRLQALVKLTGFDTKLRELSKMLHKNFVEYKYRETEASEEAILELLLSKDYTTILSEYAVRTAKHAGILSTGSVTLYVASNSGLLTELAARVNPLLGLAVMIPEAAIKWNSGLILAAPLLAPVTAALSSTTPSQVSDQICAPAYYLTEELYNLKDAVVDTAEFLENSVNCAYGHAKQIFTISAVTSIASLTVRAVAQTGIISSAINTLAPEVALLARGGEQATLYITKGLNPLTLAGLATIGTGSLAASTMLINNPNIKKPSTKQISYSVPKAADFIRKAAIVTTVATGAVAAYIYVPSILNHAISNTACTIGSSISHLTSPLFENSTELFTCAPPSAAQETMGEMITGAVSEAIGQTAILVGKRATLTAGTIYATNLPSLVKGAINYGISKVGGFLPTAHSAKTPNPVNPLLSTEPSSPQIALLVDPQPATHSAPATLLSDEVEGAGIQDEPADKQEVPLDRAGVQDRSIAPEAAPRRNISDHRNSIVDADGFTLVISKNQKRRRARLRFRN